jgi:hypothetical protein
MVLSGGESFPACAASADRPQSATVMQYAIDLEILAGQGNVVLIWPQQRECIDEGEGEGQKNRINQGTYNIYIHVHHHQACTALSA